LRGEKRWPAAGVDLVVTGSQVVVGEGEDEVAGEGEDEVAGEGEDERRAEAEDERRAAVVRRYGAAAWGGANGEAGRGARVSVGASGAYISATTPSWACRWPPGQLGYSRWGLVGCGLGG
jgi:hypothetical protein